MTIPALTPPTYTSVILPRRDADDTVARLLVGGSSATVALRDVVRRLGPSSIPVLIIGPTGAGKEMVARAVHAASRAGGELISVNVCAVADSMFESTLYGHVKGAFTGATSDSPGYLAEANGGSLFLDEIGALGVAAQAKLLRALETGRFRPVGARLDRTSSFRLITATNEDLPGAVAASSFRADVYHRIAGFVVRIPGLSDRRLDIAPLARHFLELRGAGDRELADDAIAALEAHDFPGNVRELRNVIDRALILVSPHAAISGAVIADAIGHADQTPRMFAESNLARATLERAIVRANGDADAAARQLGISRATLYRRVRRYGLSLRAR